MTAPLSSMQNRPEQVSGMFGAPRSRYRPRGSYSFAGVGDPIMGYSGYGMFWQQYPGIIAGQSGFLNVSTTTGATVGTPSEEYMQKVGGGVKGTKMTSGPTGASVGGTAAY